MLYQSGRLKIGDVGAVDEMMIEQNRLIAVMIRVDKIFSYIVDLVRFLLYNRKLKSNSAYF